MYYVVQVMESTSIIIGWLYLERVLLVIPLAYVPTYPLIHSANVFCTYSRLILHCISTVSDTYDILCQFKFMPRTNLLLDGTLNIANVNQETRLDNHIMRQKYKSDIMFMIWTEIRPSMEESLHYYTIYPVLIWCCYDLAWLLASWREIQRTSKWI